MVLIAFRHGLRALIAWAHWPEVVALGFDTLKSLKLGAVFPTLNNGKTRANHFEVHFPAGGFFAHRFVYRLHRRFGKLLVSFWESPRLNFRMGSRLYPGAGGWRR
jgi:hypothetical protein